MNHIVGLSGGKDSTAMALRLKELHPQVDWTYIYTPTGNELPEMIEHWHNLEHLLGKKIIRITRRHEDGSTMTLESLIDMFGALPNWRQRWCTRMLKIEPTIAYLQAHVPAIMWVGLRADEEMRDGIYSETIDCYFPMASDYRIDGIAYDGWNYTIKEVWAKLNEYNIKLPVRTDCSWCYVQRLAEWKWLYKNHPDEYWKAAQKEIEIGHTFRSPGSTPNWPSPLVELAPLFEADVPMRSKLQNEQQSCRVCRL